MRKAFENAINADSYTSRNRLLAALAVILIFSFLGTSLLNYYLTRSAIHQEIIQKDLPLTRDNIYSDLSAELARPILVASSMAVDTFLRDWAAQGEQDKEPIIKYLKEIHERYGFFSTFFVSAATGTYYHFKGVHKTISPQDSHDIWYYNFLKSDKEYDLDVDTDETSLQTLTVFINYKVFDEQHNLLGVTGVGLKVDSLAGLIKEYEQKYDRSIFLTDTAGVIQVHQDKSMIEKKSILQLEGLSSLAGQILATGEKPADFQFSRAGEGILLTVRYITQLDWFLFVEQNETAALAQAKKNLMRTIIIGLAASLFIIGLTLVTINRYHRKFESMATSDVLTGVANRRKLEAEFSRFTYLNSRSLQPFSVILIDLDGFKDVNDTLGHLVGDLVLKQIADLVSITVRPTDVVARWGGDEFVVLTPLAAAEAEKVAERLRYCVEEIELAGPDAAADDPRRAVTISCGIAEFYLGDTLDNLLYRADQALYMCKDFGGNKVLVDQG